jgi:CubicO group peptidase (beta-lactamase class C family)
MESERRIWARIEELVEGAMREHVVPGVAVAAYFNGEEYLRGIGVTNTDHPLPVDEDTLFQIGSTTKTLTATALMRLVEEGRLGLDEPVRTYLPDLRLAEEKVARNVTLRHLLTHTAGWDGDIFEDFGDGDDAVARAVARLPDLPQVTPLGTVWNYSNAAFVLAGRLLEVVRGSTYERTVRHLVLDPLGMPLSCFSAGEAITHRVAVGHAVEGGSSHVATPWGMPRSVNPAGGLVSTAREQLLYAKFHLGLPVAREPILSGETLRFMQSALVPAGGGRAAFCGLSWLIQRTPGLLAHGGATNGQRSSFVIVPPRRFAMTVLTNSDSGALLHRGVVKWVLRNGLELRAPHEQLEPLAGADLELYRGHYETREQAIMVESTGRHLRLSIERRSDRARLFAGETSAVMTASAFEGDRIRLEDGPEAGAFGEFLRDAEGSPAWLRVFGRVHVRNRSASQASG